MTRTTLPLSIALLVALAGPALAGDKVFRLKNGRKITGELVEENATSYVIKTPGGRTTIQKDTVVKIEDAPEPEKPPEKKKPPEDATPPDRPPVRPVDPGKKPGDTTKPPAKNDPGLPSSKPGEPLASPTEIAEVRTRLKNVPKISAADPRGSTATRNQAIDEVAKTANLGAIVAIAADPENAAHPYPTAETELAIQILQQKIPSEKSRPLLVKAMNNIELRLGVPTRLLNALNAIGDTPDGAIAMALVAKVADAVKKDESPITLLSPLENLAQNAHLAALFKILLSCNTESSAAALAKLCRDIVFNNKDRDASIAVITPLFDTQKLPPYIPLAGALSVFSPSKAAGAFPVGRALDTLERQNVTPDQKGGHDECLRQGYQALVQIPVRDSRERIIRGLDDAREPQRRILILEAFKVLTPGALKFDVDFLSQMVERMNDRQRTDAERHAFAVAMHICTNRNVGEEPTAWKEYIDTLKR